jgi:hypothetical protein
MVHIASAGATFRLDAAELSHQIGISACCDHAGGGSGGFDGSPYQPILKPDRPSAEQGCLMKSACLWLPVGWWNGGRPSPW